MEVNWVQISDCAKVLPGFSFKSMVVHAPDGSHQIIVPKHLKEGEPYRFISDHVLRMTPDRSVEKYLLSPGDILFMSRGTGNYSVLLEDFPQPAIAPSTFHILKAKPDVSPGYLVWCLGQKSVTTRLNEIRTHAGTPMVPREGLGAITIPLPPRDKQELIASMAGLQARERRLKRQLMDETSRLQQVIGQRLWNSFEASRQE